MATTTSDRPLPALLNWLGAQRVEYEVHEHERAYSAAATARAEGVDPATFAKVVGVRTAQDREAFIVLDAPDRLDLHKARRALATTDVRLLTEDELAARAPSCEVGAIPAIGSLFGVPTYADYAVRDDPAISFNAGSHRFSVRVARSAWEQASRVIYGDFARDADDGPVWSRS